MTRSNASNVVLYISLEQEMQKQGLLPWRIAEHITRKMENGKWKMEKNAIMHQNTSI